MARKEFQVARALSILSLAGAAPPDTLLPCDGLPPEGSSLPADRTLFYVAQNVSYMNAATLGPMPRPALSCSVNMWESFEGDPLNMYPWGSGQELDSVRSRAATTLG